APREHLYAVLCVRYMVYGHTFAQIDSLLEFSFKHLPTPLAHSAQSHGLFRLPSPTPRWLLDWGRKGGSPILERKLRLVSRRETLTLPGLRQRHLDPGLEVPDRRPRDGVPRSQRPPGIHFRLIEEHNGDPCPPCEGEREPEL